MFQEKLLENICNKFIILVDKTESDNMLISYLKSDSHFRVYFYLVQWKHFKNNEKCFLFHVKRSFRY